MNQNGFEVPDFQLTKNFPGVPPGATEARRKEFRQKGLDDLYFFVKGILGYDLLKPSVHMHLCKFVDTCDSKRRMILMPRSHFKTTIVTIGSAIRDIVRDANVRILVVASSSTNAERFLTEIKNHFIMNDMFKWIFPEFVPDRTSGPNSQWNASEMRIPRTAVFREPTVDTIGARGTVESRHYNKIYADDIIGEKELQSDVEMGRTIEWSMGLESLLISAEDGEIDFVGTHWRHGDVYGFLKDYFNANEAEPEPMGPFATRLDEIAVFNRGCRDENGEAIFPEIISTAKLDRLQKKNPLRYAAQYANDPLRSGESVFSPDDLMHYTVGGPNNELILFDDDNGDTVKIRWKDLDIVTLTDPSVAESRGASDTAIITVGRHEIRNLIFVLSTNIGQYPIDEMADFLFEHDANWHPRLQSIEAVAYQKSIKHYMRLKASAEHLPLPTIREFTPGARKTKDDRIRGLQPLISAHQIYILPGMRKLIDEVTYYTKDGKSKRDGLDALSQLTEYYNVGWDADYEREVRDSWDERLSKLNATGYGVKRVRLMK